MIGDKLPETEQHHEDDEVLVVLSKYSRRPLVGVRGGVDWVHSVENLQPSARYKIRLHLRPIVSHPFLKCTLHS